MQGASPLLKIRCLIHRPRRGSCRGRWWESRGGGCCSLRPPPRAWRAGAPRQQQQQQEGLQAAGHVCPEAQAAATSLHERTPGHRAVTPAGAQRRAVSLPTAQDAQSAGPGRGGLPCKHQAFKCTKQVSRSWRGKLSPVTGQTHTPAPQAGEEAGLHLPALGESGRGLPAAQHPPLSHWRPPLVSALTAASAHQIEEAVCIKTPSIFQLSSFGTDQN